MCIFLIRCNYILFLSTISYRRIFLHRILHSFQESYIHYISQSITEVPEYKIRG